MTVVPRSLACLLAPPPADAVPPTGRSTRGTRKPTGSALAGREQVVLYLSAGPAGSRTTMAVLNGSGALLSGSDAVLFRTGLDGAPPSTDCDAPAVMQLESVSGRFQPDGSSCGTRWRSAATDDGRDEDLQWESVRSDASAADAGWLRSVLVDLLRRAPAESH